MSRLEVAGSGDSVGQEVQLEVTQSLQGGEVGGFQRMLTEVDER